MVNISSLPKILVALSPLLLTTQAAVPQSTWVGQPGTNRNPDPNANLTFAINVPSGNSNELFFHLSSPAAHSYAAFGIGTRMQNSLMFIAYASEDGKNVTLSPRLATGNSQPRYTDDVAVQVLSGSGIIDGNYVVNAKCSNCRTWSGGSVDVTNSNVNMIWAIGPEGEIDSDNVEANIQKHRTYNSFTLDFAAATGEAGVPIPQASSDNTEVIGGPNSGQGFGGRGGTTAFHAFILVAAFLVVFPTGFLFLRVFEKVVLHWAVQSLALVMSAIGVGLGVSISKNRGISPDLNHYHQILGFVVLGLLLMTWGIGLSAHMVFRRTGKPAKFMIGHRILGPATMGLGLGNCFVGFRFASNTRAAIILLVAAIIMIVGIGVVLFFVRRRKMRKAAMNTPAAFNFREGQMNTAPPPAPYGPNSPAMPHYGQGGIPLQSYQNNQPPPTYR
ncbi:hypothetical protein B0A52_06688 [Exophiala mesophila]|uniref:DOMON domain-containing protein n=1 Tax=Exophiala mesophila TaxID=212818 RepID=A0A438N1U7_EXOME|nr:hypothetical protein B0A52_06688 [Exophiala mesophila]